MSSRKENKEKQDKQAKLLNTFIRTYDAQYNRPKGGPLFFVGKTKNNKVAGAFVSLKVANSTYDRHDRTYVISTSPIKIDSNHSVYIFGIPKNIKRFFKSIGSDLLLTDKFIEYGENDASPDGSFNYVNYNKKTVDEVIEDIKRITKVTSPVTLNLNDVFMINNRIGSTNKKGYSKIIERETDKENEKVLKRPVVPTVKRVFIKVKNVPSNLQSKFQYLQGMVKGITEDNLKLMNVSNYSSNSTSTIPVATRNLKKDKDGKKKSSIATITSDGVIEFKPEYFSVLNGLRIDNINVKNDGYLFTYVRLTNKDNAIFNYYHFLHEIYDMRTSEIISLFKSTAESYSNDATLVNNKNKEFDDAMRDEDEDLGGDETKEESESDNEDYEPNSGEQPLEKTSSSPPQPAVSRRERATKATSKPSP